MRKIVFSMGLLCCSIIAFGQQNLTSPVQSKWEVVGPNVELNYYNSDYCDYYLVSTRQQELWVRPGKNNLVSLPKDKANRNDPAFQPSSFKTYKGYFPEKLNPDFLYSLPVKAGKETQYKVDTKRRTLTYLFETGGVDTVYAVRGGIVCKNNDQGLQNKEKTLETSGSMLVYHTDYTFALYEDLSKVFVKEGERIKVGQPVGISSPKKQVSMSFFYLDKNKFTGSTVNGLPHTSFNPVFHTTAGNAKLEEGTNYTNEWNDEVITQEMSKREKKKYEKQKTEK